MKSQKQKALAGYTIVEVMIFLAVSGGLLTSVMTIISGQQQKTQFTTGVREFESKIQDIISDVETGYFPSGNDVKCADPTPSGDLVITPVATEQGKNQDCVFLGKAVQFYRPTLTEGVINYRTITIAGKRQITNPDLSKREPLTLEESKPKAFYINGRSTGLEEGRNFHAIEVSKVRYGSAYDPLTRTITFTDDYEELGFVQSTALRTHNNTTSNLGNGRVSLARLDGAAGFPNSLNSHPGNPGNLEDSVKDLSNDSVDKAKYGVVICLQDGTGGRPAAVTIGLQLESTGVKPQPSNQRLAVQAHFDDSAEKFGC